jgi:hypothetical protein
MTVIPRPKAEGSGGSSDVRSLAALGMTGAALGMTGAALGMTGAALGMTVKNLGMTG